MPGTLPKRILQSIHLICQRSISHTWSFDASPPNLHATSAACDSSLIMKIFTLNVQHTVTSKLANHSPGRVYFSRNCKNVITWHSSNHHRGVLRRKLVKARCCATTIMGVEPTSPGGPNTTSDACNMLV